MPPETPDTPPRPPCALLALLLVAASGLPAPAAGEMSDDELEDLLDRMQDRAGEALEHYENNETEQALEDARFVREQFAYESGGASELERAIKRVSAVSIGDRVKGLAARYAAAIEAGDPVEQVRGIQADLGPSLNRLVLVSQGKHAPGGERRLDTNASIETAADEVLAQVEEAARLYEEGQTEAAQQAATEAFFTYESNGLGPDTSVVDEAFENRVENLIKNFQNPDEDPGLVALVEEGAPQEKVDAQVERIREAIGRNVELLKATKPARNLGDADGDGQVTIVDALWTAQASLGLREAEERMDANRDGQVTIVDALFVAQAALGIRSL